MARPFGRQDGSTLRGEVDQTRLGGSMVAHLTVMQRHRFSNPASPQTKANSVSSQLSSHLKQDSTVVRERRATNNVQKPKKFFKKKLMYELEDILKSTVLLSDK